MAAPPHPPTPPLPSRGTALLACSLSLKALNLGLAASACGEWVGGGGASSMAQPSRLGCRRQSGAVL